MDEKYLIWIRVFQENERSDLLKHCTITDKMGEHTKALHEVSHVILQAIIDGDKIRRLPNMASDGHDGILIGIWERET